MAQWYAIRGMGISKLVLWVVCWSGLVAANVLSDFRFLQACNGAQGADSAVVADRMWVVQGGVGRSVIAVASSASERELEAVEELQRCVEIMSGVRLPIEKDRSKVEQLVGGEDGLGSVLLVGELALELEPSLREELRRVSKRDPVLRSDAIAVRRRGNCVYVAGNNADSHCYAVIELLRRWGCRWYLPTEIGECIPKQADLWIDELDYVYGSPFEVRRYWLSWLGDDTGKREFMRRNRFNDLSVPSGHNLGQYTKELIPEGKSMFQVPISEDRTAEHVAAQLLGMYREGKDIQLGMEDGVYESQSASDTALIGLQYDKYFQTQSYTDAFMTFYNKVARRLKEQVPESKSRIGFLAYSNITLPPVMVKRAEDSLVAYLAPIDFDPIHSMDDLRSAPRRELKEIVYEWSKVMQGRVVLYDYDQSMLVWRDIPNPSHQAFVKDVQHYRKAGILGVDTESRGATGTTFLNLAIRGELLWNPECDIDAFLKEFYVKFYSVAAEPMSQYWTAIYGVWEQTLATEHEYFVAPAIYTPELLSVLRGHLQRAEELVAKAGVSESRDGKLLAERMKFTRMQFELLEAYMGMVWAANTEVDYAKAVSLGERGLAVRERMTEMNGTFTTYKKIGESGYAWWPGEVQQYRELLEWTDGEKGKLVSKLPLRWSFRRDPKDEGLGAKWYSQPKVKEDWTEVRSDLYVQGQGVVTEDYQSYTGHFWYDTELEIDASEFGAVADQGALHLRFPGIFNECWLYINGQEVAHRPFKGLWWLNDYRFEWDVDVSGKLVAGANRITLRHFNPHHFGGMFRRPFVYRVVDQKVPANGNSQQTAVPNESSPVKLFPVKAFHIPPETTTEESGYFSLCEGLDGKIYIGTAAYGRNAYLVEFDPKTEAMRVVLDVHRLVGLPLEPTGYAAQSKLHTRNYVGSSGKIYVGSKQGYPTAAEKKLLEAGGSLPEYVGGYVMSYDPSTQTAESYGMPMPLTEGLRGQGKKEGQGVIDVTADESRGILYVITCEEQHWMLYDFKSKTYRDLGVTLRDQPNTLIDAKGRGCAITADYRLARYVPGDGGAMSGQVFVDALMVGEQPLSEVIGKDCVHPDWRISADGTTGYLQFLNDLRMFRVDLRGEVGAPVVVENLGIRKEGKNPDSRGSISVGPDGRVYSVIRIDNETGFGTGYLHHVVRHDPKQGGMVDLGVLAVSNPEFFDFQAGPKLNSDGSPRPVHGFHRLPDGTLTPLHAVLGMIVTRDGTLYATTLYPFTLMKQVKVEEGK